MADLDGFSSVLPELVERIHARDGISGEDSRRDAFGEAVNLVWQDRQPFQLGPSVDQPTEQGLQVVSTVFSFWGAARGCEGSQSVLSQQASGS